MSKLACNIAMYRPDPTLLAANYRPRQAEMLLGEAAVLIDRCLADFKEYCALDYAWNHFLTELRVEEKEADLERPPEPPPEPAEPPAAEEEPVELTAEVSEAEEEQGEEEQAPEVVEAPPVKIELPPRAEATLRKKELSGPGQPFALNEQRDLILKRLCRDYEEALNRVCVAEEGLRNVFGHPDLSSPVPSEAEALSTSITNLAIWIRDANEWLTRYRQREESFTRVISARSLLNRGAWTQLRHARDRFSLKLQVPSELFASHDNCRLRGIGASVVGEVGTVQWSVVVRLPEEAVYERSGQSVAVDQSDLPPCLLGRVEGRRSPRPIEICGVTTLANASPVGRSTPGGVWSVEIVRPAGASHETFGHLEDVLLEISVFGIPRTAKS